MKWLHLLHLHACNPLYFVVMWLQPPRLPELQEPLDNGIVWAGTGLDWMILVDPFQLLFHKSSMQEDLEPPELLWDPDQGF